jgi:hypothetical protein
MNTIKSNINRLNALEVRIPTFLKEKEFAFSDLRPLVITLADIEDNEYTAEELAPYAREASESLTYIEQRATELGY